MKDKITDIHDIWKIITHIDAFGKNLSKWEVGFISNLIDDPTPNKKYSQRQIEIINRIYDEKC